MSAEQPRAYNYVATQDFSANSSEGGGGANSNVSPNQYQLEPQQNYDPSHDAYRPTPTQQHYYPVSETPQQPAQAYSQHAPPPVNSQSHPIPPPVNAQSHPGAPAVNHQSHPTAPPLNYQSHPSPQEYKPPPPLPQQQAPYGDPSQQWGQMSFDEKFKPPTGNKPKWNDLWAAFLFLAVFIAFAVMSGFTINAYRLTYTFQGSGIYSDTNTFSLNSNSVILFAFILATAFFISAFYFFLARVFTKQFIWVTGILHCLFGFGTAIVYFVYGYYSAAITFVVFAVFYTICFLSWRRRIPFATQMLMFTMDVMKKYPSTIIVSFVGLLVTLVFGAWWSVSLVSAYVKYHPNSSDQSNPACDSSGGSCSSTALILILIFFTFAGFYITEMIKNIIHTTISGIYGSFYFGYNTPAGVPRHAACSSFRRCMTYSFGSISFGSLIVSLIQFIQQLASVGRSAAQQEGDQIFAIIFCVLQCLAGLITRLVQYFNHYAYTQIALYGKSYLNAARDTWALIKDRGFDAIINDLLIDNVLTMGSVFVAYVTAFLAYLYLKYTNPAYNSSGGFNAPIIAFAFLIGLQMTNVAVVPIKSGMATLFVAMAEDPQAFYENFPDLYQVIAQTYPQLMHGVPRGDV